MGCQNILCDWRAAIKRWKAAGKPRRTDEEVDAIFYNLCKPCRDYSTIPVKRCKECGCRVNRGRRAVINKIRMGTEGCPRGKWKATT